MNQCLIMIEMTKTSTIVFTMKNEKNRKRRKISFFKALIWLRIEANQTCQRTATLFMENLLPNGVLEKLRIC